MIAAATTAVTVPSAANSSHGCTCSVSVVPTQPTASTPQSQWVFHPRSSIRCHVCPVARTTVPHQPARPNGAVATATRGHHPARCRHIRHSAAATTTARSTTAVGRTRPAAMALIPASAHLRSSTPTSAQVAAARNRASV